MAVQPGVGFSVVYYVRARMVCRSAQINLVDPRRVSGGEKGQKNARIAGRLWSEDDGCSRGF